MLLPLPPVQKVVEPGANEHATPNTAKPPHRPMVAILIEKCPSSQLTENTQIIYTRSG